MQQFFREWHAATEERSVEGVINISEMPIIREMNERLVEDMNNSTYMQRFEANVCQLELLASEIVAESGLGTNVPNLKRNSVTLSRNCFAKVFSPASRAVMAVPS